MEELNNRARVADERHREDSGNDQKEYDLQHKIPTGFVPEVFTADVEK